MRTWNLIFLPIWLVFLKFHSQTLAQGTPNEPGTPDTHITAQTPNSENTPHVFSKHILHLSLWKLEATNDTIVVKFKKNSDTYGSLKLVQTETSSGLAKTFETNIDNSVGKITGLTPSTSYEIYLKYLDNQNYKHKGQIWTDYNIQNFRAHPRYLNNVLRGQQYIESRYYLEWDHQKIENGSIFKNLSEIFEVQSGKRFVCFSVKLYDRFYLKNY